MAQNKIESYIGFSFKMRKITLGYYSISALSGGVYLLILDSTAKKNSLDKVKKLVGKFKCPMISYSGDFEKLIGKKDCKIAAIRDRSLAEAIQNCDDINIELFIGGV